MPIFGNIMYASRGPVCDIHDISVMKQLTDGAKELAKKYNAEIINADSVQVYKKIDIASAKVTEEEKEDAGTGPASEGLSGYDRARGGEVQHRSLHPRQPVSHGDGAEKLPAHDG